MFEKFDLPYRTHMLGLYSGTFADDLKPLAPARLVPIVRTPEGSVIGESLAIAETLAERHPDKGFWPESSTQRARARWLCAEMASGFSALRSDCPMQLRHVNSGFIASDAVRKDLSRIETLWHCAWDMTGSAQGWLFGSYSLADVFFAPVAARIIGYDLDVSDQAHAYCLRAISDPTVVAWRTAGLEVTYDPFPYDIHAPVTPWPAP